MKTKYVMSKFVMLGICCWMTSTLFAAPLDPNERRVVVNDGDTLTLQDLGDEYYSVTRTEDGYLVVADDKNVLYYADEEGKPSKFKARNSNKRGSKEKSFLKRLNRNKTFSAHRLKHRSRLDVTRDAQRLAPAPWVPTVLPQSRHSIGHLRFPIILVEGDGKKNLDSAGMYARLNEENYTKDSYLGSVRDYFVDQSAGVFVPTFDVYLVSESEPFSEYIGNESTLMKRAVLTMMEKYPLVDWSIYDSNNDGEIDAFGVLYAGPRYYSGTKHLGGFQTTIRSLGVKSSEGKFFGTCFIIDQGASHIVAVIHEFSHTMGLKDHYCVWDASCSVSYSDSAYQAPGTHAWDVMATGMYNGSYRKPPNYSAFERNYMGWLEYMPVEEGENVKFLPPLATNNYAYYQSVNENEWYVFENRQLIKWDSGLPNHGMLVWHIDYNANAWSRDALNDVASHQRVDIIEAGDVRVLSQSAGYMTTGSGTNQKDDPFPGSQNVTKLTPIRSWAGEVVLRGLFDITEENQNVCFTLSPDYSVTDCRATETSSSSVVTVLSSSSELSSSSVLSSSAVASSSSAVFPWWQSSSSVQSSSSAVPLSSSALSSSSAASSSSAVVALSSSSSVLSSSSVMSSSSSALSSSSAVSSSSVVVALSSSSSVQSSSSVLPSSSSAVSSSSARSSSSFVVPWLRSSSSVQSSSSVVLSSSAVSSSSVVVALSSSSSVQPSSSAMLSSSAGSSSSFVVPWLRSSSSVQSSSSWSTVVNRGSVQEPRFSVAMEGRILQIYCPEPDFETVRVFDMQGHVLATSTFEGTSFRMDLGTLAYGTSLVVQVKSRRGMVGYYRIRL